MALAQFNQQTKLVDDKGNGTCVPIVQLDSSVGVSQTATAVTVQTAIAATTNGSVSSGARSITFKPATGVTATVMGWPLIANVDTVISEPGCTLNQINYTVSGGALNILVVR